MASTTAPTLRSSWASTVATRGDSFSNSCHGVLVKVSPIQTAPSQVVRRGKARQAVVRAEYRRGGGAGDFVAGFLLGGVVFGALGYLIAPQVTKSIAAAEKEKEEEEEGPPKKLPRFLEDDEGLEVGLNNYVDPPGDKTRKNLNDKIAQLNAAIDDVSAQLRSDEGFGIPNDSAVELESAA